MRVPLAAERAQDETPLLGRLGRPDGGPAQVLHLVVAVRLARQLARVRVVAVGRDGWVVDHDALEVEAAVAEVEDHVDLVVVVELRARAAEDLALAQGRDLRDEDLEAGLFEGAAHAVDGGVELDGADDGDGLARGEVALERGQEVGGVDADVDKDVEGLDLCHVDGDEAAVGVVDEQVAAHGAGGVVVDAAGAVGDVAHDEGLDTRAELGEDVGDGGGEEEEALRHLQGDLLGARGADAVDGFGNFEAVVGGEDGDGGLECRIIEDLGGYLVQKAWASSRLCDYEMRMSIVLLLLM